MKQLSVARSRRGFTIVELLIVIVVISILAAIVIVAYNGISKSAVEASMRNDLESARNAVAIMKGGQKNYPEDASAANNGQGLKATGNNQILYAASGTTYSVVALNDATDKRYCLTAGQVGECTEPIVATFVGTRTWNTIQDGTGTEASFGWPTSIAVGSDGSFYVGDCGRAVRKITPEGVVTTLAGDNNISGYVDDQGSAARFRCIVGITVDQQNNDVYVATHGVDFRGIRKITQDGTVSTIAGSATTGSADGTGTAASFQYPQGITFDDAGNLYITDSGTDRIRMITPLGEVSTIAGSTAGTADGTGSAAQFDAPHGIVMDSEGNFFVTDSGNRTIRKVTPGGEVTTVAGSGADARVDGNGLAAAFGYPTGITIDENDNLYITDNSPYSIRKITPDMDVTTITGEGTWGFANGIGMSTQFGWMENGITFDSNGFLYVADSDNYLIRRIIF